MELRDRIILRMNKLGLTPSTLAASMGKTQSSIHSVVSGRTKTYRDMRLLAEKLKTTIEWLSTGVGSEENIKLQSGVDRSIGTEYGPDLIPILGYANASNGAVLLNYDEPIGEALRHPKQKGVKKAFWLSVYDESMVPRYYPNELAAVAGDRMPVSKADCVIEMQNGETYIKQFVRLNDKELICKQLNPSREWKRPRSEIRAIHAIVGRG